MPRGTVAFYRRKKDTGSLSERVGDVNARCTIGSKVHEAEDLKLSLALDLDESQRVRQGVGRDLVPGRRAEGNAALDAVVGCRCACDAIGQETSRAHRTRSHAVTIITRGLVCRVR